MPELISCGIAQVDAALGGGLPLGGISELAGTASSGRTTLAWATVAAITQGGGFGAYVDASDAFDPLSAAALGVELSRLLWVRAGGSAAPAVTSQKFIARTPTTPAKRVTAACVETGSHGEMSSLGRGGHHPRAEAIGVDRAVSRLFNGGREVHPPQNLPSEPRDFTPRCAESIRRKRIEPVLFTSPAGLAGNTATAAQHLQQGRRPSTSTWANGTHVNRPGWGCLDRVLRATDLLLSAGGFRVVVLDLGDVSPEYARRVPLATWYRFRLQAEKTQAVLLLLTQASCAHSCAAVSLHCDEPQAEWSQAAENSSALLTGVRHSVSIWRNRAADSYHKKPVASAPCYQPQPANSGLAGGLQAKRAPGEASTSTPHYEKGAHSASGQVCWTSTTLWSR